MYVRRKFKKCLALNNIVGILDMWQICVFLNAPDNAGLSAVTAGSYFNRIFLAHILRKGFHFLILIAMIKYGKYKVGSAMGRGGCTSSNCIKTAELRFFS